MKTPLHTKLGLEVWLWQIVSQAKRFRYHMR